MCASSDEANRIKYSHLNKPVLKHNEFIGRTRLDPRVLTHIPEKIRKHESKEIGFKRRLSVL